MITFNSVIELNSKAILLKTEELDSDQDADGYVRFKIFADERKSVIHINMDYFSRPFLLTQQDAEDYFEKINYPEFPPIFSEEEVFTELELTVIGQAIVHYVLQGK